MFEKIRYFIRKHFIGFKPSDIVELKADEWLEDNKIENIKVKSNFTHNQKQIVRKINERIDEVNKLKDDRK